MFQSLLSLRRRDRRPRPDADSIRTRQHREMPGLSYTAEDRRRDFCNVFRDMPAGRRVLAQTLGRCRVCERSYVPGDSLETARREGMRDVGLWILEILAEETPARPGTAEDEPVLREDA